MHSQNEGEELLLRPQLHLSIYQVSRELKKENQSLWNCVQSILSDAAFVEQVRVLWPGIPQLANLRCGSWYTKEADGTCYFKSTDGHNGNWSFSPTRLNWHVAELAAQKGGVVIVDATRNVHKGGFPDALTKTIPIWAAVINRAIARVRSNVATPGSGVHKPGWDTSVHLPLWVSSNETKQIEGRLDAWVGVLLSVGADVVGLSKIMKKPLRPLWVSQASKIWVDMVAQPEDLPFTPLILVSASHPTMHGRRQCTALHHPSLQSASPAHASPTVLPQQQQQQQQQQCHFPGPNDLAGPPGSTQPEQSACSAATGAPGQGLKAGTQAARRDEVSTSYLHVPGAGDDEESWACGLTPALMWQHAQALTAAGPQGVRELVQQLLATNTQAAATAPPLHSGMDQSRDLEPSGTHAAGGVAHKLPGSKIAKALLLGPVRTDDHHLRPQGCVTESGSSSHQVTALGQGIFLLAELGVAVGGFEAGAPPGVWSHVDAVLNVGVREHAGMLAHAKVVPNHTCCCKAAQPQANGQGGEACSGGSELNSARGALRVPGGDDLRDCDAGRSMAGCTRGSPRQRQGKGGCTACAGGGADKSKFGAQPMAGSSRATQGRGQVPSGLPGGVCCSTQAGGVHEGGVLGVEGSQQSGYPCPHAPRLADADVEQQEQQEQRGAQGGRCTLHAHDTAQSEDRGHWCQRETERGEVCEGKEGHCCEGASIVGTCQHGSLPSASQHHRHGPQQQQPQQHHLLDCSCELAHSPGAPVDTAAAGDADAGAAPQPALQAHSCSACMPNADAAQSTEQQQQQQQQQQYHQPLSNSNSSSSSRNYLWLPVAPAKLSRFGLSEALAPALQFLSDHLSIGRRVLVHDDQGVDQSVCIVLALLLACYDWTSPGSAANTVCCSPSCDGDKSSVDGEGQPNVSRTPHGAVGQPQQPKRTCQSTPDQERQAPGPCHGVPDLDGSPQEQGGAKEAPKWRQPFLHNPVSGAVTTPQAVSKHAVRQRLAFLAACYPQARPTRGMLKQVFNFFEARKLPQELVEG